MEGLPHSMEQLLQTQNNEPLPQKHTVNTRVSLHSDRVNNFKYKKKFMYMMLLLYMQPVSADYVIGSAPRYAQVKLDTFII